MAKSPKKSTIYRAGLVVPKFEIDTRCEVADNINGLFNIIFRANGDNWPSYASDQHRRFPQTYINELVIPPTATKPLVVIRDSWRPTAEWLQDRDKAASRRINAGDPSDGRGGRNVNVVTKAVTEKSILIQPDEGTLAWRALVTYKYNHKGGASFIDSRDMDKPVVGFEGYREAVQDSYDIPFDPDLNYLDERRALPNNAFKVVLDQFIDYIGK